MDWVDVAKFLLYPPIWLCIPVFVLVVLYYTVKYMRGIRKQKPNFWDYM